MAQVCFFFIKDMHNCFKEALKAREKVKDMTKMIKTMMILKTEAERGRLYNILLFFFLFF